ncbi:MAG: WYL domain-containing protein [Malacoplasma sp.]|nr:WYL domain-containing protein [Malacoplasma sp.]
MKREYLINEHTRINISKLAHKIIMQDLTIFSFTKDWNQNKFINEIIYLYLKNFYTPYEVNFDFLKFKGDSKEMRLNKKTINEYEDLECKIHEKYQFERPSQFFKAIVETYARLSFTDRENINLQDCIEKIEKAISEKNKVIIKTYKLNNLELIPYKIFCAKEGPFSYLIGFDNNDNIRSIRISQIESIRKSGNFKKITEEKLIDLEEKIAEFGATFAEELIEDVKIQFLTQDAENSYAYSIIHRPIHTEILDKEKRIYLFKCSLKQAEFFFFRFAGDIKILEPDSLRNKFIANYKKAIKVYE